MDIMRKSFRYLLAFLLAMLALAVACVPPPMPTPTATPSLTHTPLPLEVLRPAKRVVTMKVEGKLAHFLDQSFWDEAQFSAIMERKAEFESDRIEQLKGILSGSHLEGANYAIGFDEAEKSTSLRCDVDGAVSKSDNSYYGRFGWLLRPLGLDFIDDHFEESKKGLSWEGIADNIPTRVICEFPAQDVPYAAWAHPIGHCHAHVWWTMAK